MVQSVDRKPVSAPVLVSTTEVNVTDLVGEMKSLRGDISNLRETIDDVSREIRLYREVCTKALNLSNTIVQSVFNRYTFAGVVVLVAILMRAVTTIELGDQFKFSTEPPVKLSP